MKKLKLPILIILLGIVTVSCKTDKETKAEKAITDYQVYVDSINELTTTESKLNWDSIENQIQQRKQAAQNALNELKDKKDFESKILVSTDKYELYKNSYLAEKAKQAEKEKPTLRKVLFSNTDIGEDLNFSWVNKDNILSVYEKFITTVEQNKDAYSREDWDEIKLLYEALDSQKNTVEKEGLSSSDNMKIAKLKIRFAPMLAVNRIGAKVDENEKAKE